MVGRHRADAHRSRHVRPRRPLAPAAAHGAYQRRGASHGDLVCSTSGRRISGRHSVPLVNRRAGSVLRLRPKLMTVSVVMAGLVAILWSTGVGADIMKPIAAPIIGGHGYFDYPGAHHHAGDLLHHEAARAQRGHAEDLRHDFVKCACSRASVEPMVHRRSSAQSDGRPLRAADRWLRRSRFVLTDTPRSISRPYVVLG